MNFEELERYRQIFQFHKGAIRTTGKTKILVDLAISIP